MVRMILQIYLLVALKVFMGRIEAEDRQLVPASGPLILVANHLNGFIDPLVIQSTQRRKLTVTAKNTLAQMFLYGALMRIVGVVQFYRKKDWSKGADPWSNAETIAECKRRLARGEALCIFPEGTSHTEPTLYPFKRGVARIALEFAALDGRPQPLAIVPVGQTYEPGVRFRPRILARYGEPVELARWRAENHSGGRQELTAELESRVRSLTPDFRRRRDPLLVAWAVELLASGKGSKQVPRSFAEDCRRMSQIQNSLARMASTSSREHQALLRRLRGHRITLRRFCLSPRDIYRSRNPWRIAMDVANELGLALIGLPITLWGVINHLLICLTLRQVALRMTTKRDGWTAHALYFSLLVVPAFYALQIGVVWALLGSAMAVGYALLLPSTGYAALLYMERLAACWKRTRALVLLLPNRPLHERLRNESDALRAEFQQCCGALTF
jgi:glycerol-3-phosphate O-acyltransferase / dihydroxyacetone phosphate acyltransferase